MVSQVKDEERLDIVASVLDIVAYSIDAEPMPLAYNVFVQSCISSSEFMFLYVFCSGADKGPFDGKRSGIFWFHEWGIFFVGTHFTHEMSLITRLRELWLFL